MTAIWIDQNFYRKHRNSLSANAAQTWLNISMLFDRVSNPCHFSSKYGLNLRKKLEKCHIWSRAFYGAEIWTLWRVHQKYLESFEMWCCRRVGKISWTDRVGNEEVLQWDKKRNILQTIKSAKWFDHILRRNCLLKHVTEGNITGRIEVAGKR